MHKSELRSLIRQRKRQFTQQQLCELSLPIIDRVRVLLRHASTIVAYYSLDDEVDTHRLIDELLAAGKTVYLPRVVGDHEMVLCRYTGADSLQKGAFGIMEPVGTPMSYHEKIDVVLVPGVAFDAQGHRLGRGRGYYDRFLAALPSPRPQLIGVCFDFQKVDGVPTEVCDVSVDVVA
jgi:5-formyltetrahydrofolate cyclo-ligase